MKEPGPHFSLRTFACAFILTLHFACGDNSQFKALDRRSISQEVTQMLHDYHRAIREDGLLAEFEYLENSSDFFWVPPGYETALGYDSVRAIIEDYAPQVISADYRWDSLRVIPLAPSFATFYGVVSGGVIKSNDPSRTLQPVKMIESGVVVRRGGRWCLLSGQTSDLSDPPADVPKRGDFPSDVDSLMAPINPDSIVVPSDSLNSEFI